MLQVKGTKSRTVIDVQFSWEAAPQKGFFQGINIRADTLREIKLAMGDQAGMIIKQGNEIAFFILFPTAIKGPCITSDCHISLGSSASNLRRSSG